MNSKVEEINPYSAGGHKHEQVREMFDNIAPAYDVMNRMMTCPQAGVLRYWSTHACTSAMQVGVLLGDGATTYTL